VSEPKVVIAGTGRAGTTLLVRILTQLGLDTGFGTNAAVDPSARSGLELGRLAGNTPRIVKNPAFSTSLRAVLTRGDVEIERVIIPMRDLDVAAASRVRVSQYGRRLGVSGGMWHTNRANNQRDVLANVFYELMWTLVEFDVPHTFLAFPRFASDPDYLAEKLAWLAPTKSVDDFRCAIALCTDTTLITQSGLSEDERRRARFGTAYATLVAVPLNRLRRFVRSTLR
jgi:hypothetical protein